MARVFKASYTSHYRAGLIQIIEVLEFGSTNTVHAPMVEALALIKRYKADVPGQVKCYAAGERVPVDGIIPAELAELMYQGDGRRRRILRTVYECGCSRRCGRSCGARRSGGRRGEVAQPRPRPAGRLRGQASRELRPASQAGDRDSRGRRRRPPAHRGRPAVRAAPVPHRRCLPASRPDHRQCTFAARQATLWGEGTTAVASDSTHFSAFDQNIFSEWHSRYRRAKRGVLIYWTVDTVGSMAVHSHLISCSASEVHAMVEGAMRHGTDMEVEQDFVDSHGASFVGFGSPGCWTST